MLPACGKLLSDAPAFVLLNVYVTVLTQGQIESEAEELRGYLKGMLQESQVAITAGELGIEDTADRKISASVFARAKS